MASGRLRSVVLFTLVLFAFAGCTTKQESSTLQMLLPNFEQSSLTTNKPGEIRSLATLENLKVIIVNVTGPGIPSPIFFEWDRDGSAHAPSSVELSVPKGTARLAQVLFVFENNDGMQFYYGDSVADLKSDQSTMRVAVSQVGGSSVGDGSISGRYYRADGSTPTGRVLVKFKPAGDRPAMIVSRSYIIGGWFTFFSLQGANFTYALERTGEVLFDNINVTSPLLLSAASQNAAARIDIPPYYYYENWSGGTPVGNRYLNPGKKVVIGLFGPGASAASSTQKVCFEPSSVSLSHHYVDSASPTLLQWNPVSGTYGSDVVIETINGIKGALSSCPGGAGSAFTGYLKIEPQTVVHHDGGLGFKGPFVLQPSPWGGDNMQEVVGTFTPSGSSGSLTLNWKYLPGSLASSVQPGIGGVGVFIRSGVLSDNNRPDYETHDGIACNRLEDLGFIRHSEVGATDLSQTTTISGIQKSDFDQGKFQAILCPYFAGVDDGPRYLTEAAEYHSYSSGGGFTVLEIAQVAGKNAQETSTCVDYKVQVKGPTGSPLVLDTALNVDLRFQHGDGELWSQAGCTGSHVINTGLIIPVSIPSGSSSATFSFKSNYQGYVDLEAIVPDFHVRNLRIGVYSPGSTPAGLKVIGSTNLVAGQCYPYDVLLAEEIYPAYLPRVFSSDEVINLGMNGLTGQFYTSQDCSTVLGSTIMIPAGNQSASFYFKPSVAGETGASISAAHGSLVTGSLNGIAVGGSEVSGYRVSPRHGGGGELEPHAVTPMIVHPENSVGAGVSMPAAKTLTITSASGGSLCASMSCPGGPVSSLTVSIGSGEWQSTEFFFIPNGSSSSVHVTVDDSALATTTILAVNAPEVLSFYAINGWTIGSGILQKFCMPLQVKTEKWGAPFYVTGDYHVSLTENSSVGAFYSDSSCAGPTISSVVVPSGSYASMIVYYMASTSGFVQLKAASAVNPGFSSLTPPMTVTPVDNISLTYVSSTVEFEITQGGTPVPLPFPVDYHLNITGGDYLFDGVSSFRGGPLSGTGFFAYAVSGTSPSTVNLTFPGIRPHTSLITTPQITIP